MKIKDIIEKLKKFDKDEEVIIRIYNLNYMPEGFDREKWNYAVSIADNDENFPNLEENDVSDYIYSILENN